MAFKIDRGLFNSNPEFTDHYAILGVPVTAEPQEIRKRFLRIARRLHPDSSTLKNAADRQLAGKLLSKLVNPAYEYLLQEKNLTEYRLLLSLKGKQAQKQHETVTLTTAAARELAASSNPEQTYQNHIQSLSKQQYDSLNSSIDVIGQISELNLVYLMKTSGIEAPPARSAASTTSTKPASSSSSAPAAAPAPSPVSQRDSLLESYIRRAEEYERKQDYPKAILELREALKMKPNNANCHSRLGVIYLNKSVNQPKMAKIHFAKALEIDPKDPIALAGQKTLQKMGVTTKPNSASANRSRPSKEQQQPSKGGLFGLFGRGK